MKSNYPTKPKTDGPEIHVELIRIPKPIISRKEFVMENAKQLARERDFERNQKATMELMRKMKSDVFDAEIEQLKRRKAVYNRVARIAAFFALLGWLFLLGKAVLEWN